MNSVPCPLSITPDELRYHYIRSINPDSTRSSQELFK